MATLDPKPDPFRRGQLFPGERVMNQLRDISPRQIRGSKNSHVVNMGDRVVIDSHQFPGNLPDINNYLTQFVVREELDDVLRVVPYRQPLDNEDPHRKWVPQIYDSLLGEDPDADPVIPYVEMYCAKPWGLQKTPWNGQTVTFNQGTPDEVSETYTYPDDVVGVRHSSLYGGERINTPYFSGDVIFASQVNTGLYRMINGVERLVVWEDLNILSRRWTWPTKRRGTLLTQLNYLGFATMSLPGGGSIVVNDWLLSQGQIVAAGKKVTAFFEDNTWWLDGAQCP